MSQKIVVFWYSQSGQALDIARQVCRDLSRAEVQVVYKEILPRPAYPFPWSSEAFFEVFPESRLGIPCAIEPLSLEDVQDVSLVIVAWQPWYLSPSIPIHAFFQSPDVQTFLKNRKVLSITGSRNMWVMAMEQIRTYLRECGASLVGQIALNDRHANLISVTTIVRWLIHGKKQKTRWLPAAGVADADIEAASGFGMPLIRALSSGNWHALNHELRELGAATYNPALAFVEQNGHRIFGVWARAIARKGATGSPGRALMLTAFRYYLFSVIYLVSPFGILFFWLTLPLRFKKVQKHRERVLGLPEIDDQPN